MSNFRDRRDFFKPSEEDYDTPLTRASLVEANRRFRQAGVHKTVGTDHALADRLIKQATKTRFNGRRKGQEDFGSVGAYLKYLTEQAL